MQATTQLLCHQDCCSPCQCVVPCLTPLPLNLWPKGAAPYHPTVPTNLKIDVTIRHTRGRPHQPEVCSTLVNDLAPSVSELAHSPLIAGQQQAVEARGGRLRVVEPCRTVLSRRFAQLLPHLLQLRGKQNTRSAQQPRDRLACCS